MSPPQRAAGPAAHDAPVPAVILAFAAIYLVWGSTYLAIRFAIETIPPLVMASVRFVVAGGILYAWARASGQPRPTRRQWRDAALVGALMLAGGNGAVVVAEQWVPSGLAALLVGAVPLWLALLDWLFGARVRPSGRVGAGLVLGFTGLALLTGAPGVGAGGVEEVVGALLIIGGSASWAVGSLVSRYAVASPRPRMWVALQMLTGSVVLAALAAATGELGELDVAAISARSAWSLAYLITFGALLAYTAYIWLLGVTTPARAGTYAYVNPVVAMILGWALADEPLTFRSLGAAAIILGSVVMITSESGRGAAPGSTRSLS